MLDSEFALISGEYRVSLSSDLYTPAQRARRNKSGWTLVQGVLAPLQFVVFLISVGLIVRFLWTGEGESVATLSVLLKTFVLYLIMVTGAVWEKEVFGQYLFVPAFFWEDVVSVVVLALHTFYIVALFNDLLEPRALMWLALIAYLSYVINAAQFLIKFRLARAGHTNSAKPVLPEQRTEFQLLTERQGG